MTGRMTMPSIKPMHIFDFFVIPHTLTLESYTLTLASDSQEWHFFSPPRRAQKGDGNKK
jgi:hypothetical protein